MEYKDYYKTLGVPRTATQEEIKKQFRKLARKHHPDVNKGDPAAEQRFKEISEADEVLADPEKRRAYDAMGADWEAFQRSAAGGAAGGTGRDPFAGRPGFAGGTRPGGIRFEYGGNAQDMAGFSDFFQRFFGGAQQAATSSNRASGQRVRQRTRDRAEDRAYDDLLAELGGLETQPGSASRQATAPRHAEAEAEITLEEAATGTERLLQVEGKRFEVKIPAGVDTGRRIRLRGKAGTGPDAGDVYLNVVVKPHAVFTRKGDDLTRELPITLREALLGGEVTVETLTGRVLLRIPPETQPGRTFRLAGKGMPTFRGEGRGALYVKVRVVLPTGLDDEARELARAFLDPVHQPDPRGAPDGT